MIKFILLHLGLSVKQGGHVTPAIEQGESVSVSHGFAQTSNAVLCRNTDDLNKLLSEVIAPSRSSTDTNAMLHEHVHTSSTTNVLVSPSIDDSCIIEFDRFMSDDPSIVNVICSKISPSTALMALEATLSDLQL